MFGILFTSIFIGVVSAAGMFNKFKSYLPSIPTIKMAKLQPNLKSITPNIKLDKFLPNVRLDKFLTNIKMGKFVPSPTQAKIAVDLSQKLLSYKNAPSGLDSSEYRTCKPQLEKAVQDLVDTEDIILEECSIAPEDQTMATCKVKLRSGWREVVATDQNLVKKISQVSGKEGKSSGRAMVSINGKKVDVEITVITGSKYYVSKAK